MKFLAPKACVGIVVLLATLQGIVSVSLEIKSIGQKMEIQDLSRTMKSVYQNRTTCSCQFTLTDNVNHFDSGNVDVQDTPVDESSPNNFDNLRMGCANSDPILARRGKPLPGSYTGLIFNMIQLGNLMPTGVPDQWSGNLKVDFESTSQVRALRPATMRVLFTVDA